ncbi:MAG TPA: ATP-grasp domain-containing protein [Candidatus Paceibacterota bacterium]|nr:ATP-grasp domain-containing protein [Candidatus Paceibacterota bacterium]
MKWNPARPVVYVARDIERALGMEPRGNYFVVSNDTPQGRTIRDEYPKNVILVASAETLDTFDLLALPEVEKFIKSIGADVVVFQNTPRIERLAVSRKYRILNPSADLAKMVEEKISQVAWLDRDANLLPSHRISTLEQISYSGSRFVLQFNHAHTGHGTFVINSEDDLRPLREKFPYRECRVTDFIEGPIFTVNALVGDKEVIIGNPSYQITGIEPFTDLPFSTIGNDWSLPQKPEYEGFRIDAVSIAQSIGARLRKDGWKGLFGIDLVYEPKTKKTYLLEINSRQAASATFESELQKKTDPTAPTLFELHISSLLGESASPKPFPKVSGSQIVKRVTETQYSVNLESLRAKGLTVLEYQNDAPNKELFRIQSSEGIMESHGTLNGLGEFIRSCIRKI